MIILLVVALSSIVILFVTPANDLLVAAKIELFRSTKVGIILEDALPI